MLVTAPKDAHAVLLLLSLLLSLLFSAGWGVGARQRAYVGSIRFVLR